MRFARTKRILRLERRARKMVDERDFRKLRRTAVEAFFAEIEPVSVTGSAGMKSVDECPPKQSATSQSLGDRAEFVRGKKARISDEQFAGRIADGTERAIGNIKICHQTGIQINGTLAFPSQQRASGRKFADNFGGRVPRERIVDAKRRVARRGQRARKIDDRQKEVAGASAPRADGLQRACVQQHNHIGGCQRCSIEADIQRESLFASRDRECNYFGSSGKAPFSPRRSGHFNRAVALRIL